MSNIKRSKGKRERLPEPVEIQVHCPNCYCLETLEMVNGELDTERFEEHGGVLCRVAGKFYQIYQNVYHKCTLTGERCTIRVSNKLSL